MARETPAEQRLRPTRDHEVRVAKNGTAGSGWCACCELLRRRSVCCEPPLRRARIADMSAWKCRRCGRAGARCRRSRRSGRRDQGEDGPPTWKCPTVVRSLASRSHRLDRGPDRTPMTIRSRPRRDSRRAPADRILQSLLERCDARSDVKRRGLRDIEPPPSMATDDGPKRPRLEELWWLRQAEDACRNIATDPD